MARMQGGPRPAGAETRERAPGWPPRGESKAVGDWFQALDHFARVFAFRGGEKVLVLADPLLDPRVIDALRGLARSRGAELRVYMEQSTRIAACPDEAKPLLERADFVVSTWFCSVIDPFCIAQRQRGQRWVKITYFRDLDLLATPQGRFPPELVGEIVRATARRLPQDGGFELAWSDPRGSDLRIGFTDAMRANLLAGNRWRGKMIADEPGCYVHYLPAHGPNLWDRTAHRNDEAAPVAMSGWIFPTWAVGFERPWTDRIGVRFEDVTVVEVSGEGETAAILREMLVGGKLIELGCGFAPKSPRHVIYPAGSNHPGALHFGIDLAKPSDWIRRTMPDWEEPPIHMDLITLDSTVEAVQGARRRALIEGGFLSALRDPEVVAAAERWGDPVFLLETED
jgi:hypothetical protein